MRDGAYFLTKHILEHADRFQWKRNSNCIVLNLAGSLGIGAALSIFDSRYRGKDGELVHSHHSDFHSRIVAGVMHQQRYTEVSEGTLGSIKCIKQEFDVDYKPATPAPVSSFLIGFTEEHLKAGRDYSIIAPELHRTWPDDGTVTLRITKYDSPRSGIKVFWRPGESPRKAAEGEDSQIKVAPDAVTPMMLKDIVANCLQTWF